MVDRGFFGKFTYSRDIRVLRPVAASGINRRAQATLRRSLVNTLSPQSVTEAPATLPPATTLKPEAAETPQLISHMDHLSVEDRLHLLEVDIRGFGIGLSKEQRQTLIGSLSLHPRLIQGVLIDFTRKMLANAQ